MLNDKTVLAVIPARGGSKRVPRKNIKDFRGKPLILWTIEAAQQCKFIDTLVVSTEDAEIKSIAEQYCSVIDRPPELATDTATNEDVLRHALVANPADIVVLLQPTSPLRNGNDIKDSILSWCETHRNLSIPMISCCVSGKKNGAIYLCSAKWLRDGGNFGWYYFIPFWMPPDRSLDIDYPGQFNG